MAEKINNININVPVGSYGVYILVHLKGAKFVGSGVITTQVPPVKFDASVKLFVDGCSNRVVRSVGVAEATFNEPLNFIVKIASTDDLVIPLYKKYEKLIGKDILIKVNLGSDQNFNLDDDFEVLEVK
jgi:hypothetical protein